MPDALRRLDEGRRGQQLPLLAGHPQQQLVALDPARGEVADRLRVKAEAVVGERVADPGGRSSGVAPARAAARSGRGRGRSGCGPLPSPGTSPGRRRPGRPRRRRPALAAEHRDADADRRAARRPATGRALSATWARRSSPRCSAPAVSVCGIRIANSSPERRATMSVARTRSRIIPATWRIR